MWKKTITQLAVLLLITTITTTIVSAEDLKFILPETGGAMAHSDTSMSDYINLPCPTENVQIVWHHNELSGEKSGSKGLGFSSNGHIAAATYTGLKDNLIIYDYDGNRLWTSKNLLNAFACGSAPLIDIHNRVIACDNRKLILVDPLDADQDGIILEWTAKLIHGGLPISPTILQDGTIFIATKAGPLYLFDSTDGTLLATKYLYKETTNHHSIRSILNQHLNQNGYFETINTPAIQHNRAYISTQYNKNLFTWARHGRLYAIDIHPNHPNKENRLQIAWYYNFNGPSGASPLLINNTLYFDTERSLLRKPGITALTDIGDTYHEKWKTPIPYPIDSSLARDPRHGFWIVDAFGGRLIRKSTNTGKTLDIIHTDTLLNKPGIHKPCSVITICNTPQRPILINAVMSLNPLKSSCYILAIDLANNNSLLWTIQISEGTLASLDFPFGQYPILMKNNNPRLVFTTIGGGAWAIGGTKSTATY